MQKKGALGSEAKQFMYFETGQGSEFTYGKHNGMDMTTAEALCYGLARRYDPFMVNNVTGFIGPETHLDNFEMIAANLQDHFMGKLLGLPMGMAPCYTLHSKIGLEGQQMATEMLTAAGANFFMDVCLNTDRMLAYFDTSSHDNQTLREIHDKEPAPDYLVWALDRGIFRRDADGHLMRGENWGNPRMFCQTDAELEDLLRVTPSVPGFLPKDHAGPRPANDVTREIRRHQAIGRGAIQSELDLARLSRVADFRIVKTKALDKASHLNHPDFGAELGIAIDSENTTPLTPEHTDIQIVVSDGLSADAVHHNISDLFPVLLSGLKANGFKLGRHILAPYGRVKLAEPIAKALGARCVIFLIGERPGGSALASRSLSAYMVYHLLDKDDQRHAAKFSGNDDIQFEYSVLSNIYDAGTPAVEAASVIVEKVEQMLRCRAAGNRLESLLNKSR
jgi:ethanolamine ammonia-lyase large subunit